MSAAKTRQARKSSRSSFGGGSGPTASIPVRRDSRRSDSMFNDAAERNKLRRSLLSNKPVFGPESSIEEIADYLQTLNKTEINQQDIFGRNLLHLAASLDDPLVLNAILENLHVDLNAVDLENHWTPLHRALHNGNIDNAQVLLERNWAYIKMKDRDDKTPFDILNSALSSYSPSKAVSSKNATTTTVSWNPDRGGSELFLFGSNINNTLGFSDSDDRSHPELIRFDKTALYPDELELAPIKFLPLRISDIKLSKYHSVACVGSKSRNNLLVCGISRGGRLGLGKTTFATQFKFTPVPALKTLRVISVDVGVDHTVVITSDGGCYTWGQNKCGQLGYPSPTTSSNGASNSSISSTDDAAVQNEPKRVTGILRRKTSPLIGCAASNIHTVVYTSDVAYTWGKNVGQMGIPMATSSDTALGGTAPIEYLPRHLAEIESGIAEVACGDNITAILDRKGHVRVYASGRHYAVYLPQSSTDRDFDLYKPCLKEETITSIRCSSGGWLGLKSDLGNLYRIQVNRAIGYNSSKKGWFVSSLVWRSRSDDRKVMDFDIGDNGLFVITCKAGVWKMRLNKGGYLSEGRFKFDRVSLVNRIVQVRCDDQFKSFATIRDDVSLKPIKVDQESLAADLHYLVPFTNYVEERKRISALDTKVSLESRIFKDFSAKVPRRRKERLHKTSSSSTRFLIDNGDLPDSESDTDSESEEASEAESDDSSAPSVGKEETEHTEKWDDLVNLKKFLSNTSEDGLTHFINSIHTQASLSEGSPACFKFVLNNLDRQEGDINIMVPVLKFFVLARTDFFKGNDIPRSKDDDVSVIDGEYTLTYNSRTSTFTLGGGFKVLPVMAFLYELYTGIALPVWHSIRKINSGNGHSEYLIKCQLMALYNLFKFKGTVFSASMSTSVSNQTLGQDLALIRNNPDTHPDIRFLLKDGKTYLAHSSILKSRSAFFDVCLSDRWTTSREHDKDGFIELTFDTTDIHIFDLVMKHIYSDATTTLFHDVDVASCKQFMDLVLSVMDLAEVLMLNRLLQLCEATLMELINIKNVGSILDETLGYSVGQLKSRLLFYVCHNIETIMENRFLIGVSESSLKEVNKAMHKYIHRPEHMDDKMRAAVFTFLNDPFLHDELTSRAVPVAGSDNNVTFMSKVKASVQPKQEERAVEENTDESVFSMEMEAATSTPTSTPASTSQTPLRSATPSYANSPTPSVSYVFSESNKTYITTPSTTGECSTSYPKDSHNSKQQTLKDGGKPATVPVAVPQKPRESPLMSNSRVVPASASTSASGSPRRTLNFPRTESSGGKKAAASPFSTPGSTSLSTRATTFTLDEVTTVAKSAVKLSQKERKERQRIRNEQMLNGESKSVVDSRRSPTGIGNSMGLGNPWNLPVNPAATNVSVSASPGRDNASWPSLSAAEDLSNIPIPLSEIMKEEQMKAAQSQVRSLEEIQEEEAFKKWWDEESKRVQRELAELENMARSTATSKANNNHNKQRRKPRHEHNHRRTTKNPA